MHSHAHDHHEAEQDHTGASRRSGPDHVMLQAAAAGRLDVLGPAGLLALQRTAGNEATGELLEDGTPPVLDVLSSGGQSLDEPVRRDMEARMGHDFSDVKVHTDAAADKSARSVSAHAFTVGSNIVFQRGAFDPASHTGQTLLAHELTHVVQQRSGPVDGTPMGNGVSVSDPSDRFEREAASNADHVMSQPAPQAVPGQAAATGEGAAIQREEAPAEEEQLQMSVVQREEAEEDELPA